MCRAIYDYDAADTDELSFKEGENLEIVKKGRGDDHFACPKITSTTNFRSFWMVDW